MIICQRSQMTFSQNMKRENFDVCQWMSWNHSKIGGHHFYFVSPQQCLYVCRAAKAVDTAAPCDMNEICSMMRLKTKNDQTRSPLELIEVPLRGSSIRKNQSMAFPIFKAKLCACFKLMSHSLDFMFRLTVNRMVIDWRLFFKTIVSLSASLLLIVGSVEFKALLYLASRWCCFLISFSFKGGCNNSHFVRLQDIDLNRFILAPSPAKFYKCSMLS